MISCDRLYVSSEHPQLTQLIHVVFQQLLVVFIQCQLPWARATSSLCAHKPRGKSHPNLPKIQGKAGMHRNLETFLAAVLPTMDKRMSENSALKMSASSLEKFRNGFVRRLETSFLKLQHKAVSRQLALSIYISGFRPQKRSSHFNSIMAAYCLSYFAHLLVQHL